jgi:hypothetical protein
VSIDGKDAEDAANQVAQAVTSMGAAVENAATQSTNAFQNFGRAAQQTGQQIPVYLGTTATAAQRAAAGMNAVFLSPPTSPEGFRG